MHNPILSWTPSVSGDVTLYRIAWSRNGSLVRTVDVPVVGGSGSYSRMWTADNSDTVLADSDVVSTSLKAVDSGGNESSAVSSTLTIPSEPPEAPTNVTLSL